MGKLKDDQADFAPSKLTRWLITAAVVLGLVYGSWYGNRWITVALVNQGLVVRGLSNRIQACEADLVRKARKAKNAEPVKKGADVIDKDKK